MNLGPMRVLQGITPVTATDRAVRYVHEAFLYRGRDDLLAGAVPFVRSAVSAGAPVLVAVDTEKIAALRGALADAARHVEFVVMTEAGRNPGRVISLWRDFVGRCGGQPCVGLGEPIWPTRTRDELVECQQHEQLLNHAFSATTPFHLRCPYDVDVLGAAVVDEAIRSHPQLAGSDTNSAYVAVDGGSLLRSSLDRPPVGTLVLPLSVGALRAARHALAEQATAAGFSAVRRDDIVLVASELETNALHHGAEPCTLRSWSTPAILVVEVRDAGRLDDPLVGRRRPEPESSGGRGLWLVHELADLVQVRSDEAGTTVRASFRLPR
jgi:anti-sigma regulatory factor (Ser/Thr protein kinase)